MNLTSIKSNSTIVYDLGKEFEKQTILDIVENLPRIHHKVVHTQENEFAVNCPFCKLKGYEKPKRDKLYINIDSKKKGYIIYNCFRCGTHGSIPIKADKSKQYLSDLSFISYLTKSNNKYQKNNKNKTVNEIGKELSKQAKQYLYNRHVSEIYYKKQNWKEGKTDYRGHILIPIYELGKEVAFITRDYTGKAKIKSFLPFPNKTKLLYNIDTAKQYSDIIITEGVFDALQYPNAVALFGKRLYEPQAYKLYKYTKAKAIIVCLDSPQKDPDIQKAVLQVVKTLQKYVVATIYVCILPYGDPADYSYQDFYEIIQKNSKKVV